MGISNLTFSKDPLLSAYGPRYHAFLFPNKEVVVYCPEASKVVFRRRFPSSCEFTSVIITQEDSYVILFGLSNGQVLRLDRNDTIGVADIDMGFDWR